MTDEKRDPLELLPPEVRERAEVECAALAAEVERDTFTPSLDTIVGTVEELARAASMDHHARDRMARDQRVRHELFCEVCRDSARLARAEAQGARMLTGNSSDTYVPEHALARSVGWTQAALWLRTDAARAAFVDAGAMSISYADRQVVANVLEAALSRCAEGTPMDVFNQAVAKRGG